MVTMNKGTVQLSNTTHPKRLQKTKVQKLFLGWFHRFRQEHSIGGIKLDYFMNLQSRHAFWNGNAKTRITRCKPLVTLKNMKV